MKNITAKAIVITLAAASITCAVPAVAFAAPLTDTTIENSSSTGLVVDARDYVAYVNCDEGLNIRQTDSTESTIINKASFGDAVHVTGRVFFNGLATGWVRVETVNLYTAEKCDGFVVAEFLSDTPTYVAEDEYTQNDNNTNKAENNKDDNDAQIEGTEAYYAAEEESDAIANVIDEAIESGIFTQEEIDDNISLIYELKAKKCTTEEERMERSDEIAGVLNEMQQQMIDVQGTADAVLYF